MALKIAVLLRLGAQILVRVSANNLKIVIALRFGTQMLVSVSANRLNNALVLRLGASKRAAVFVRIKLAQMEKL